MDLDKAWLYRQGNWTEVDNPAAQFPEEIDNLFEKLHYNQAPRTYGVSGEHYVAIYDEQCEICQAFVSWLRLLDRKQQVLALPITPEVLRKAGVIKTKYPVKILGDGELKVAITVHAHKFSKSAQEKITKAGGKVEVLAMKAEVKAEQ